MHQKWQHSTHRIVTRIPKLVGQVWELSCRVELGPLEATNPRLERIAGQFPLEGAGVWSHLLAKDEAGNYCLIEERCVTEKNYADEIYQKDLDYFQKDDYMKKNLLNIKL